MNRYKVGNEITIYPLRRVVILWDGTIAATVANRVDRGWRQFSPNQVAKVDHLGFLDVVTYEEMTQ